MSVTKPLMLVLSGSNGASCLESHDMGDWQLQRELMEFLTTLTCLILPTWHQHKRLLIDMCQSWICKKSVKLALLQKECKACFKKNRKISNYSYWQYCPFSSRENSKRTTNQRPASRLTRITAISPRPGSQEKVSHQLVSMCSWGALG